MALSSDQKHQLITFVQQEPCTVQDVAKHLGVSWVTAERYVQQVEQETGEVRMKVFRSGTRGALKIVYHALQENVARDEVEKELYKHIRAGRYKHHFDFMDIYQHISEKNKRAVGYNTKGPHGVVSLLQSAQERVLIFSGNLSLFSERDGGVLVRDALAQVLSRGVQVNVLCRVTPGTLSNLSAIKDLLSQYPQLFRIRHAYQPLRGIIVDNSRARFKDEENPDVYRNGELDTTYAVFYELSDEQWIVWLSRVFFNIWRTSGDGIVRKQELENIAEKQS